MTTQSLNTVYDALVTFCKDFNLLPSQVMGVSLKYAVGSGDNTQWFNLRADMTSQEQFQHLYEKHWHYLDYVGSNPGNMNKNGKRTSDIYSAELVTQAKLDRDNLANEYKALGFNVRALSTSETRRRVASMPAQTPAQNTPVQQTPPVATNEDKLTALLERMDKRLDALEMKLNTPVDNDGWNKPDDDEQEGFIIPTKSALPASGNRLVKSGITPTTRSAVNNAPVIEDAFYIVGNGYGLATAKRYNVKTGDERLIKHPKTGITAWYKVRKLVRVNPQNPTDTQIKHEGCAIWDLWKPA